MVSQGSVPVTDTRERILWTSLALFVERGYAAVSVNDICKAAEVAKGGFYHHFESKETLFRALLMEYYVPELTRLRKAIEAQTGDARLALLTAFRANGESLASLRGAEGFPESEHGMYYVFLEGMRRDEEFRLAVREHYAALERTIRGIVERGIASGAFSSALDAGASARAMIAQIEGGGMLLLIDPSRDPVSFFMELGESFLALIDARSAGEARPRARSP
jgi:TetR/AcrR family transcriptional regulator, transcriptional repressor for nem operon